MSYGIAAFAVDIETVRREAGRVDLADGYALERLCRQHGEELDNNAFSPVSGWAYLEMVDEALARAELLVRGFSLEGLVTSGSPVPIPASDEFPVIGHLRHADLAAPAARLATAPGTSLPEEFGDPAYTLYQWLATADAKGLDLVTFYH